MQEKKMAIAIAQVKVADPPHALQLFKRDKPSLEPGRVLVRITVRPIHPGDLIAIRKGYFLQAPHDQPPVVGVEGFGIVEEVGEGVTKFKPGQRVVTLVWPDQGSWQDYVALNEDRLVAVPDSVSDEAAAQFMVNPWTVYGMLDDLAIPKGEYLLQTAASSVLGRQVIQLAKVWGVKTINIVRRDSWKEELKALGANEVINSETEGSFTKIVASSVRDGGSVLVYGMLSSWDITLSIMDLMRGVKVSFWILQQYIKEEGKEALLCTKVMELLENKVITPLVGKKFPLKDFLVAIEESEKESRGGKVLLVS